MLTLKHKTKETFASLLRTGYFWITIIVYECITDSGKLIISHVRKYQSLKNIVTYALTRCRYCEKCYLRAATLLSSYWWQLNLICNNLNSYIYVIWPYRCFSSINYNIPKQIINKISENMRFQLPQKHSVVLTRII